MKSLLTVIIFVLLFPLSHAQDQADSEIEEVIVIDDLSLSEVKEEIAKVEENVYKIFSANNSSDKFDFDCRKETPTGSHISQRICEPAFLIRARAQNVTDYLQGLAFQFSQDELMDQVKEEFEQMSAEFAELTKTNSTFAQLLTALALLNARLAEF